LLLSATCSLLPPPGPLKNIKRHANTLPVSPIRTHLRQARISAPPAPTPQQPLRTLNVPHPLKIVSATPQDPQRHLNRPKATTNSPANHANEAPREPGRRRPPANQANEDPQPTRQTKNPGNQANEEPRQPGKRRTQATRPTKNPGNQANEEPRQPGKRRTPREPGQRRTAPPKSGPRGGSGGSSPRESTASPAEAALKGGEHRATPGGYGGKPPGVAFIGVPTGARNAGSGAPTGDQSTDMNVTRKRPLLCQDLITTRSPDTAEQVNHEAD
jgi:hypothetical protein